MDGSLGKVDFRGPRRQTPLSRAAELVGDTETLCQISRLVRLSRFHDQVDPARVSYFLKRIGFENHQVGEIARRDLTEFAFLSQSLRRVEGGGLDCLKWSQSGVDQQLKLVL